MMFRFAGVALMLTVGMSTMSGCSTYYNQYAFEPGLAEQTFTPDQANPGETVRTFASISGIRREDPEQGIPESVEVRFRIDNTTDQPAFIEPSTMRLVTADLVALQPAIIADGDTTAPPDSEAFFIAWFPFPAETNAPDFDLSGMNISWSIRSNNAVLAQSATYSRRETYDRSGHHWDLHYGHHYGYPRSGYGFGYGFSRHYGH